MRNQTALALLLASLSGTVQADWADWWRTPDQQGQNLTDQGDFAAAAEKFTSPERIGAALFQAGDFEQAAAVFGRSGSAESAYNRGNALVMLGRYEEAIKSYQVALKKQPGWQEAEANLQVTELRLAALAPPQDDHGGTGGMLEADEIVLDTTGRTDNSSSEQVVQEGGQELSEEAMRALWLRRVETSPADFLAARFAYQLAMEERASE